MKTEVVPELIGRTDDGKPVVIFLPRHRNVLWILLFAALAWAPIILVAVVVLS